jgi:hypothetical protein
MLSYNIQVVTVLLFDESLFGVDVGLPCVVMMVGGCK